MEMKFCPKCSLKIKGDLNQCPICKVELLSCAEDEELTPQLINEDHQQRIMDKKDIPSTKNHTQDKEHTIDTRKPLPKKAEDKTRKIEDYPDFVKKMSKLENRLNEIEDKFNIVSKKSDIFKIAMLDLESRISKLDQSLDEMKESLESSLKHTNDIDGEFSKLEFRINHLDEDLESVKSNLKGLQDKINRLSEEMRDKIRNLESNLERLSLPLEERQIRNELPPERIITSDEKIEITDNKGKDFETEFESYSSSLSGLESTQPEREKKKRYPLIIGILILTFFILSSLVASRYFKSQKQNPQKEVIVKRIEIPPISKALNKKKSLVSKETEMRRVNLKEAGGYTINVGSFRNKEGADRLTKKLAEKGYPVLMLPSKNKWYKVRVGAFPTIKEARAYAFIIKKKEKLPTFITEINKP